MSGKPVKIRVAYLVDSLASGGTQTALADLVELLDNNRFDVSVITLTSRGDRFSERIRRVARLYFLQEGPNRPWTVFHPAVWCALRAALGEIRPHLLHARLNGSLFFAPFLKRKGLCPRWVFTIEGSRRQMPFWTPLVYRLLLKEASIVFSDYPDEYLSMGLSSEKLRPYYGGLRVPERALQPLPDPLGKPYPLLLSVGRLHPDKGHQFAVEAMPAVLDRYPDAVLAIVGEGPYHVRLKRLAAALSVSERVKLMGYVAEPDWIFKRAAVYLNLSLNEKRNLAHLKACHYGVPAVYFHTGLRADFFPILHREHGLEVPSASGRGVAEAVFELLGNETLYRSIREKLLSSFPERLTMRRAVKDYEAVYEKLAEDGGRLE